MRFFTKLDDDDQPICLFRVDPASGIEEGWSETGWRPTPGFFEDCILEGSFGYCGIAEADARRFFAEAFA